MYAHACVQLCTTIQCWRTYAHASYVCHFALSIRKKKTKNHACQGFIQGGQRRVFSTPPSFLYEKVAPLGMALKCIRSIFRASKIFFKTLSGGACLQTPLDGTLLYIFSLPPTFEQSTVLPPLSIFLNETLLHTVVYSNDAPPILLLLFRLVPHIRNHERNTWGMYILYTFPKYFFRNSLHEELTIISSESLIAYHWRQSEITSHHMKPFLVGMVYGFTSTYVHTFPHSYYSYLPLSP